MGVPPWPEPYPGWRLAQLPERPPGRSARYGTRESLEPDFIRALAGLAPRERAALLLCDVVGYPPPEAAEILGASEARFRVLLARGRAAFRPASPDSGAQWQLGSGS